jgi:hypothetical protein
VGAEPSQEPIRVVVVEDEPLLRDLLQIALSHQAGLAVAGVFGDAATALAAIPPLSPQMAVLDIDLGRGLSGIPLGLCLSEELPRIGIGKRSPTPVGQGAAMARRCPGAPLPPQTPGRPAATALAAGRSPRR